MPNLNVIWSLSRYKKRLISLLIDSGQDHESPLWNKG